jgi:type IV pilus assembly protein PilM
MRTAMLNFQQENVVIAQGDDILFLKYIDVGGRQFDEAVARRLEMTPAEATALRKHNVQISS